MLFCYSQEATPSCKRNELGCRSDEDERRSDEDARCEDEKDLVLSQNIPYKLNIMSADETDEEAAAFYQPQVDDYCLVRFRSVVYLIKVIKLYPKCGDMEVTFYRAFDRGMATSFSMEEGKGWGRILCECHLKDVEKPCLGRRGTFLLSKEGLHDYINSDDL